MVLAGVQSSPVAVVVFAQEQIFARPLSAPAVDASAVVARPAAVAEQAVGAQLLSAPAVDALPADVQRAAVTALDAQAEDVPQLSAEAVVGLGASVADVPRPSAVVVPAYRAANARRECEAAVLPEAAQLLAFHARG